MTNLVKKKILSSTLLSLSNENAKKVLMRANNPHPPNWKSQYLVFLDIMGINITSNLYVSLPPELPF